jgi:hypothetical protein
MITWYVSLNRLLNRKTVKERLFSRLPCKTWSLKFSWIPMQWLSMDSQPKKDQRGLRNTRLLPKVTWTGVFSWLCLLFNRFFNDVILYSNFWLELSLIFEPKTTTASDVLYFCSLFFFFGQSSFCGFICGQSCLLYWRLYWIESWLWSRIVSLDSWRFLQKRDFIVHRIVSEKLQWRPMTSTVVNVNVSCSYFSGRRYRPFSGEKNGSKADRLCAWHHLHQICGFEKTVHKLRSLKMSVEQE